MSSVLRVHHEEPTQPTLDDSIPEIRAGSVRNSSVPFGGTNKFTGLGVMIGIIDSGINIHHPVFRLPNDQTKTRIAAILDQTVTPAVTFTRGQIETAIANGTQLITPGTLGINDHKHGTHVAGIAAGNGKKAGNCHGEFHYVGVAPEAELVIVKHDFGGPTTLLHAILFCSARAAAVPGGGVPIVVNMSLGHSLGPHDGTDVMDRMIDDFLLARGLIPPPAVVLVASAGNDGRPGTHATGSIPNGGVVKRLRFDANAKKSVTGQSTCRVEIRFTAPNGVGCRLIPPGNNISGGSNLAAPDGAASFTEVNQTSACTIQGSVILAPAGSRRVLLVITSTANGTNQPGEWTIELTNAGAAPITYHAWIDGKQWEALKDDVSRANTIGSPGSAADIISVGNYHSSGKDKGKLSESSSRGPRLDGLQKPDVGAPGEEICAAKRDLHTGCCCDCCCDSYIDMSGTSMAAPHVTGAIALILQRNPNLTHDTIKTVLMAQARRDSFTGPVAGNEFGAGKLDVLAAINSPFVRGSDPEITASAAPAPRLIAGAPAITAELPEIPQLEPGTPAWRLLNTPEGERLYRLGRTHWEEVRTLVNTRKRVAVAWHRNGGPMLLHHGTRTAMLPHVPLPVEWDGIELAVRAANLVSALEPYASRELIAAMHETLPLVRRLQGKTLLEVVEMFEGASELQHA
jgi:subtilisin family serine protease